ncbi:MAG: hypothetical protein F6J95_026845 [Leptolyngbya sp. SIO1E4]|nr:hypothetical protein [Leptolyngbya sp. SIO1E4]
MSQSYSSDSTKKTVASHDVMPNHQLPGQRPFVVQKKPQSTEPSSAVQRERMERLDAGVMRSLNLQAKRAIGVSAKSHPTEAVQDAPGALSLQKMPAITTAMGPGVRSQEHASYLTVKMNHATKLEPILPQIHPARNEKGGYLQRLLESEVTKAEQKVEVTAADQQAGIDTSRKKAIVRVIAYNIAQGNENTSKEENWSAACEIYKEAARLNKDPMGIDGGVVRESFKNTSHANGIEAIKTLLNQLHKAAILTEAMKLNAPLATVEQLYRVIRTYKKDEVGGLFKDGKQMAATIGTARKEGKPGQVPIETLLNAANMLGKTDRREAVITHTHPSGMGLSTGDLSAAAGWGLGEVRAVGKHVYAMKPGKDGWLKKGWGPSETEELKSTGFNMTRAFEAQTVADEKWQHTAKELWDPNEEEKAREKERQTLEMNFQYAEETGSEFTIDGKQPRSESEAKVLAGIIEENRQSGRQRGRNKQKGKEKGRRKKRQGSLDRNKKVRDPLDHLTL